MQKIITRRIFTIAEKGGKPAFLAAHDYKRFTDRAGCRSRTETVRKLRSGKAFFMEGKKGMDYFESSTDFSRINVALEALRNLDGNGERGRLFVFFRGEDQLSFRSFPADEGRRALAKNITRCLCEGATVVFARAAANR